MIFFKVLKVFRDLKVVWVLKKIPETSGGLFSLNGALLQSPGIKKDTYDIRG